MDSSSPAPKDRLSLGQYLVICACLLCNLIDGYDLSVVGFALPHLPEGFASAEMKGWLISMGLVGMAVGAIFVAPLADRFGRRTLLLTGMVVNLIAIVVTALSPNAWVMLVARFLTGLGVGTVSTLSLVLAQEFVAKGKRNFAAGMVTVGFSLGSFIGGFVGLSLVDAFGGAWQSFFWIGAGITALVLAVVSFLMPESLLFLTSRGTQRSRDQIEKVCARLRIPSAGLDAEGSPEETAPPEAGKFALLRGRYRSRSLLLWFGYAILTAGYYFVVSWTPQLITNESGSAETGTAVGTIILAGSAAGAIVFGIMGTRVQAIKLGWIALVVAVVAQVAFGLTLSGPVAIAAAVLLGVTSYAALTSYAAAAPQMYPVLLRSRGLGYMYGVSRIGSITAPLGAGYLLAHTTPVAMYLTASVLFAVSGITAFILWRLTRVLRHEETAVLETTEALA